MTYRTGDTGRYESHMLRASNIPSMPTTADLLTIGDYGEINNQLEEGTISGQGLIQAYYSAYDPEDLLILARRDDLIGWNLRHSFDMMIGLYKNRIPMNADEMLDLSDLIHEDNLMDSRYISHLVSWWKLYRDANDDGNSRAYFLKILDYLQL